MMKISNLLVTTAIELMLLFPGYAMTLDAQTNTVMQNPLIVVLVRHSEKLNATTDSELSEAGKARAEALAKMLASAELERIHSTNLKRTRDTAGPLALHANIKLELYDPRNLLAFANRLKESGGRHLVVGHSNTTHELARLLGATPGLEINDATEFDRVYIVTIGKDGSANTIQLRY